MKKYRWNKERFFANIGKLTSVLIVYVAIEKMMIDLVSYALLHCIYA